MHAEPPEAVTIRERFLADHRRLETLLVELLAAFAADDREDIQALWTKFESNLLVHLEAEEEHLIPAMNWFHREEERYVEYGFNPGGIGEYEGGRVSYAAASFCAIS